MNTKIYKTITLPDGFIRENRVLRGIFGPKREVVIGDMV
jgi:hypothetical protein